MKVAVLQSNYIPWKGYFEIIHDSDVFCFYDEVQYTKNDWRNRNKIVGPNGTFWLTIPIEKDAVKSKISQVSIKSHEWQIKHWKSIEQCYSKARYKKEVMERLRPIYLECVWKNLSDLNQEMIKRISSYIGISTVFCSSKDYSLKEGRVSRLVNLLTQLDGTVYISGPAAKNYLANEEHQFTNENISLVYKKYGPYKKYEAFFDDYVSIIDVLMNVPKEDVLSYITSK